MCCFVVGGVGDVKELILECFEIFLKIFFIVIYKGLLVYMLIIYETFTYTYNDEFTFNKFNTLSNVGKLAFILGCLKTEEFINVRELSAYKKMYDLLLDYAEYLHIQISNKNKHNWVDGYSFTITCEDSDILLIFKLNGFI